MTKKAVKKSMLGNVPKAEDFQSPDDGVLVYLAAPFFNPTQVERVEKLRTFLKGIAKVTVFSPMHDGTFCPPDALPEVRKAVYDLDIGVIRNCDVIVAILDDKDTGTNYELGFSAALRVPTIGYAFEPQTKLNLMLSEGFHAFVQHHNQAILRQFLIELMTVKLRLSSGIQSIAKEDLALAQRIQDVSQKLNDEQNALKKKGEIFDKEIKVAYEGLEEKYQKLTIFKGEVE